MHKKVKTWGEKIKPERNPIKKVKEILQTDYILSVAGLIKLKRGNLSGFSFGHYLTN